MVICGTLVAHWPGPTLECNSIQLGLQVAVIIRSGFPSCHANANESATLVA